MSISRSSAKLTQRLAAFALVAALTPACATTTTYSRTLDESYVPVRWARRGHVESVSETVQRREGNPAGGALAGAVIGGLLGGRGAAGLLGAAGGAAIGAAASQGTAERHTYDVLVHFDDGGFQTFRYGDFPPFRRGDAIILTADGLQPG